MKSVQNNIIDQRHFFYTENKWLDVGIPTEVKDESEISKLVEPKYNVYSECIDYWDEKKKKFKYNHLYRKRILKINSNELQKAVDNCNELTNLLESKGDIQGFYADNSKNLNVKGAGVWKHLNGEITDRTEENIQIEPEFDIFHDINNCLNPENLCDEDTTEQIESGNAKDFIYSVNENPTELVDSNFKYCMRELNDFKEESDKSNSDINIKKMTEENLQTENPWYKLQKCQIKQYGYHDLQRYLINENVEDSFSEEDDYYSKIIDSIMKREVSSKASKLNIIELSTKLNKGAPLKLENASITMKDKDGKFKQAIDIKIDVNKKEDNLTEATTHRKLRSPQSNRISNINKVPCCEKTTLVKEPPLKSNLKKIVNDVTQGEENDSNRDMEVELKFKSKFDSSCISNVSEANKEINAINYREKIESKIMKNKRDKITITKKELKIDFKSITENKRNNEEKIDDSYIEPMETGKKEKTVTNHRGLVKLISGSKYCGSWNNLGMEGCGIYVTPGGTIINGYMIDGILNGPATIYLPNGMIIPGTFNRGEFKLLHIQFGDGLVYQEKDWDYLQDLKKLSKNDKKWKPILNREIPQGCYDTGEGFYNPTTKIIYHTVTGVPIRSVSEREEMWILSNCRTTEPIEVSLEEQLHNIDVMRNNITIKQTKSDEKNNKPKEQEKNSKTNCQSTFYYLPSGSKEIEFPQDRMIQINKKSKPIEELWNNIRDINANFKVQIEYEKKLPVTRRSERGHKDFLKLLS